MNGTAAYSVIVRPALRFPARETAAPALLRMVDRLQAQVDAARHAASTRALDDPFWLATIPWDLKRNELTHPLSATWLRQGEQPRRKALRDTVAEFQACLSAHRLLADALHATDARVFTARLCEAAALICPEAGGRLRDMPIGLDRDADGTQVLFGEAAQVPARLAELHGDHGDCGWPPAVRAIATMAVLLNIHPFLDGNGRCARALFNVVLFDAISAGGPCEPRGSEGLALAFLRNYVPLRDALAASDGGYEIRLREAETHGNWAPLIAYFIAVFAALCEAYEALPGAPVREMGVRIQDMNNKDRRFE